MLLFYFFLILTFFHTYSHDLLDFGAIPNDSSATSVFKNGKALEAAFRFANSSDDRKIVVEFGKTYHMLPSTSSLLFNLYDLTLQIDGSLIAWGGDIALWTKDNRNKTISFISLSNCKNITIRGNGVIEGLGYRWWWHVILIGDDNRPNLLDIHDSQNIVIDGLTFSNSPQYHINLRNIENGLIHNINITVDVFEQQALLRKQNLLYQNFIPTFPLNTDGIDISGINVVIRNSTIICFDDAVAVKPIYTGQSTFTNCTQNILIEDCYVKYGIGMTLGSVPPHIGVNCIQNITVRNIKFDQPLKAIYIKSNPGNNGFGLIQHILYEKIKIKNALWWAIFIGPQQQHQPHGGADTGCSFFYPIPFTQCPTNPLVKFNDIVLRDVEIEGGILSPGLILCNSSNPCTNFTFERVNAYDYSIVPYWKGVHCENVKGNALEGNLIPDCFSNI